VRGVSGDARAIGELHATGMASLVAPLAAGAIAVDIAASGRLAQEIGAARPRATDGGCVGRAAWAVIGIVAARTVRVAHARAANSRLIGDRARATAVQLAALVVGRVTDRALTDQATCGRGADGIQNGVGVRRIAGDARAVGELGRAGVVRLVAPLVARAVGIHVAAARWTAQEVAAAAPGAANGGCVSGRAGATVDVIAALVVAVAHTGLAHERRRRRATAAVQGRARMRRIDGNVAAVGQFDRASMRALVAPLTASTVGVHVAAAGGLAQ